MDTTAVDDTFIGYFVVGLSNELRVTDNLRRASVVSAIAVSRKGVASLIPSYEEVCFYRETAN